MKIRPPSSPRCGAVVEPCNSSIQSKEFGQIDALSFIIDDPDSDTHGFYMPFSGTVFEVVAQSVSGNGLISVLIDGVPIEGLEDIGVSTTRSIHIATSGNNFTAGQEVQFVISPNDVHELEVTIAYRRTGRDPVRELLDQMSHGDVSIAFHDIEADGTITAGVFRGSGAELTNLPPQAIDPALSAQISQNTSDIATKEPLIGLPIATGMVPSRNALTGAWTWVAKENSLGNPSISGYVLSSTNSGTRSWIAPGSTSFSIITGVPADNPSLSTALSARELISNKATSTSLGTSNTLYPTQNAVKAYADTKVSLNTPITGATGTKITYDSKGLVLSSSNATTVDIADSADKRYVTDAQLSAIGSGGSPFQPLDSDLTAIAAIVTTSYGRSFLALADATAARALAGLGGASVLNVGTTTGTVAAGDDSRITGAAQLSASSNTFTGSIIGPIYDKGGQAFNIVSYGAIIGTGTTAVAATSTALQAAANAAAAAGGGTVQIPPGYTFNTTISFASGVDVEGTGAYSRLLFTGTGNAFEFKSASPGYGDGNTVRNLYLDASYDSLATPHSNSLDGMVFSFRRLTRVIDCKVNHFGGRGIAFDNCNSGGTLIGTLFQNCGSSTAAQLEFDYVTGARIDRCYVAGSPNSISGVRINRCGTVTFTSGYIESCNSSSTAGALIEVMNVTEGSFSNGPVNLIGVSLENPSNAFLKMGYGWTGTAGQAVIGGSMYGCVMDSSGSQTIRRGIQLAHCDSFDISGQPGPAALSYVATTLNDSGVTATAPADGGSITLTGTSALQTLPSTGAFAGGSIKIDSETIDYAAVSGSTITGIKRGANLTTAAAHTIGASVTQIGTQIWVESSAMIRRLHLGRNGSAASNVYYAEAGVPIRAALQTRDYNTAGGMITYGVSSVITANATSFDLFSRNGNLVTANTVSTTLATIKNGATGQIIAISAGDSNTTIANNTSATEGSFRLSGGADYAMSNRETIIFRYGSLQWYEIGRKPLATITMAGNSKLLGSTASGAGAAPSEITLGTGLSLSGSILNASATTVPSTSNLLSGNGSGSISDSGIATSDVARKSSATTFSITSPNTANYTPFTATVTGSGSDAVGPPATSFETTAFLAALQAGYTGAARTYGLRATNTNAGSGTSFAVNGYSNGAGSGTNVGVLGAATTGGTALKIGVSGGTANGLTTISSLVFPGGVTAIDLVGISNSNNSTEDMLGLFENNVDVFRVKHGGALDMSGALTIGGNAVTDTSGNVQDARLSANVAKTNQSNTYTAGAKQIFGASATTSGLNFSGVTGDPSSLAEGDRWYRSDIHKSRIYDGTAARSIATLDATETLTNKTIDKASNTLTGVAASGANSDITSLTGLTTAIPITEGGTGATTAAAARTNLGVASVSGGAVLTGTATNTVALSTTTYLGFGTGLGSEVSRQSPVPFAGTIKNLYVRITSGTQPSNGALTATLRVNGADTTLTCQLAASGTASTLSDLTHTVTVNAGDLVAISFANASSTAASATIGSYSMLLQ